MAEAKEVKTKKNTEKTPSKPSLASTLRDVGAKGWSKSREELAQKAIDVLKSHGQTTNTKGKVITPENAVTLLNSMIRDINAEREGVWSEYKVEEKDDGAIKFVKA